MKTAIQRWGLFRNEEPTFSIQLVNSPGSETRILSQGYALSKRRNSTRIECSPEKKLGWGSLSRSEWKGGRELNEKPATKQEGELNRLTG